MPRKERSTRYWQKRFHAILKSDQAEAALMLLGTDDFTTVEKDRLTILQRHLAPRAARRRSSATPRGSGAGRISSAASRKGGTSRTSSVTSLSVASDRIVAAWITPTISKDIKWSSILNMKEMKEPEFVFEHLKRYRWPEGYSQATRYLWDMPEAALLLNKPHQRGLIAHDGINVVIPQQSPTGWLGWLRSSPPTYTAGEETAIKQNVERRVNFTYDTQRGTLVQRSRELFTMLMWHDFQQTIWPDTSGSRIGPQMQEQLIPVVKAFFEGSSDEKVDKICQDIKKWSQTGKKLQTLCEAFGESALFVLCEQLSPNFIEKRMTLSGLPKEDALKHLESLGIRAITERTDLQELALSVRKHLNAPFADIRDYCRLSMRNSETSTLEEVF